MKKTSQSLKLKNVLVSDSIQKSYSYVLTELRGKNFAHLFTPELTPKQMLELGVFGGSYLNDCQKEFPKSWFSKAKLSDHGCDENMNFFGVDASQPLSVWQQKGWIFHEDPRGWFQWYCRYYMGRRMPDEDKRQISRWKNMRRHISQIEIHCVNGDLDCRKKQRQALLHWAYDSIRM
ncbi:MAG: hypothetical protein D4R90_05590 [Nitrosopumilales archaeon]|nr:MAG: hypothetical protein D4R90_05590 [Nitrosopumilales archaeon]